MKNRMISITFALLLAASPQWAAAQADGTVSGDKSTDMVVDIVIVRPLGFVSMLVGTALTVVALPFTLPSGSVAASARALIVEPAVYTFKRPLGDFSDSQDNR